MNPLINVFNSTLDWVSENKYAYHAVETDVSTNDTAKKDAFDTKEAFKLYFCATQTQGRGRNKNTWSNAKEGTQLLASFSFSVASAPQAITGPLFGLATYEGLKSTWPDMSFGIKAPNDIYVKKNKVAGLLVETVSQGSQNRLIIGLGLNILNHPRDIENATHIAENAKEFIVTEDFKRCMSQIQTQYAKTLMLCQQKELELADRVLLKQALNKCPHYNGKVKDVSPQGDIMLENKTLSWVNL